MCCSKNRFQNLFWKSGLLSVPFYFPLHTIIEKLFLFDRRGCACVGEGDVLGMAA